MTSLAQATAFLAAVSAAAMLAGGCSPASPQTGATTETVPGASRSGTALAPGPAVAEKNLKEMGIALPKPPGTIASYVPAVRTGNLLFVSGQLPMRDGKLTAAGRVGDSGAGAAGIRVTEEQAKEAMRTAALNSLAVIRAELGSLDRVRRVVRVVGYVASAPDFGNQPQVTNAASDLFVQLFGKERGSHSRLALGAAALPKNAPVELDVVVEVE